MDYSVCFLVLQAFSSLWQSVDFVNILSIVSTMLFSYGCKWRGFRVFSSPALNGERCAMSAAEGEAALAHSLFVGSLAGRINGQRAREAGSGESRDGLRDKRRRAGRMPWDRPG